MFPVSDMLDPDLNLLMIQEEGSSKRGDGRKKRGIIKKVSASTDLNLIPLNSNTVAGSERANYQVYLAIGRFFYDVGVPLDAVNSVYFQAMVNAISSQGAGVVAPTYHDLWSWILKSSVQEVRDDIDQCMGHWGTSGCSVLVDEWISEKGRVLINFMVYSSEGTMFLRSVDVTDIINSVDALFELLKEVVVKVGVRNVLQVVTSSEERYVVAGKRLSHTFPTVFWTPCAARCIDLMLQDFGKLKWINAILEQFRFISRFIYNHSIVLKMMRRYTFGLDLVELGVSSSATDFTTLKRMVNIKHNLQSMVTSAEWMESPYSKKAEGIVMLDYISNQSFWSTCTLIIRLTDPLLQLLIIVHSEKRPAVGYVYAGMYRVKETIKKEFVNKKDYLLYWNIIDQRWEQLQRHPLHAADKLVPDPKIQDKIVKETTSYHNAVGDFGRKMAMRARETLLPAEWWSTYGAGCPNLSRLAMCILSQTCSLTGCKLNKIHSEQMDKAKNCLEHQGLNDLVFVQYNLRSRQMAVKNREHDVVDPIPCDNIKIAENWIAEIELDSEDFGSSDLMSVDLPLGNIMLLGPQIDDVEVLGAGFDDYEIFGVKDSEEENGEGKW